MCLYCEKEDDTLRWVCVLDDPQVTIIGDVRRILIPSPPPTPVYSSMTTMATDTIFTTARTAVSRNIFDFFYRFSCFDEVLDDYVCQIVSRIIYLIFKLCCSLTSFSSVARMYKYVTLFCCHSNVISTIDML